MTVYGKHLNRLGIALIVLNLIKVALVPVFTFFLPHIEYEYSSVYSIAIALIAIVAGIVTLALARHEAWARWSQPFTLFCVVAIVILLITEKKPDAIVSTTLIILIVILNQETKMISRQVKLESIRKRPPVTLDLRISGKGELFDPLVMGPHLELNQGILRAVDRFLETEREIAPLTLCIHSQEDISLPLQATMFEVFIAHYEDEQQRIEKFLEGRGKRSFVLMAISFTALRVIALKVFKYDKGELWQVIGNLAAFSLWQVGSTFFESSEATEELMRKKIAMEADIKFF